MPTHQLAMPWNNRKMNADVQQSYVAAAVA